jgi:hypothetical protein
MIHPTAVRPEPVEGQTVGLGNSPLSDDPLLGVIWAPTHSIANQISPPSIRSKGYIFLMLHTREDNALLVEIT